MNGFVPAHFLVRCYFPLLSTLCAVAVLADSSTGDVGCQFYAGSGTNSDDAAYVYEERLPNMSTLPSLPKPDPLGSGICVFLDTNCSWDDCCNMTVNISNEYNYSNLHKTIVLNVIVGVFFSVLFIALTIRRKMAVSRGREPRGGSIFDLPCVTLVLGVVSIFIELFAQILLPMMTQLNFSVADRVAQTCADAFMLPIVAVFQFLEDSVTVKIMQAVSTHNYEVVSAILGIGIVGGLVLGSMAAALATSLVYINWTASFLLTPRSSFESNLYDTCPLLPTLEEQLPMAREYVLLQAWSWPFNFMNLTLRGFFLGAGECKFFFVVTILQVGMQVVALFRLAVYPTLAYLGWISLVTSAVGTLLFGLGLAFNKRIRQKYNVNCNCFRNTSNVDDDFPSVMEHSSADASISLSKSEVPPSELPPFPVGTMGSEMVPSYTLSRSVLGSRITSASSSVVSSVHAASNVRSQAIREGFQAMSIDLVMNTCSAVTVYTSVFCTGIGGFYQLCTLGSLAPAYGVANIQAVAYVIKVTGAHRIAARQFKEFKDMYIHTILFVIILLAENVYLFLKFGNPIAFAYAQHACIFVGDEHCTEVYRGVFGGGKSTRAGPGIQDNMLLICLIILVMCFFRVFKAALYASFDFAFMPKAAIITLITFLPTIWVAYTTYNTSTGMMVAMNVPVLTLTLILLGRLLYVYPKMARGEPGPWRTNKYKGF